MRVLVTGGAGFIGRHLVARLSAYGHVVDVLDNFCTSSGPWFRANMVGDRAGARIGVQHVDVASVDDMEQADLAPHYDRVYHLACPASPAAYQRMRMRTLDASYMGTRNVLTMVNADRYLLASSSEVYGDPDVHPQPETYRGRVSTLGPRSCYDCGKRVMEALAAAYVHEHDGADVRIARIHNTYGPGMQPKDGRAIPNFCCQALLGLPLTVYGGWQTRSPCYVDDLVTGLVQLMESDHPSLCAACTPIPVNLGRDEEITMRELAELVMERASAFSPTTTLEIRELPIDDPVKRRPDLGRARDLFGYESSVGLAEGLDRTLAYFRGVI